MISENNLDVLCINEHWLVSEEIHHVNLNDYILVSNFARKDTIHGGVAIFSSNKCNFHPILQINKLSVELHCEIAGIVYDNDYQIITVYRSPTQGAIDIFLQQLSSALTILSQKSMNTVVTGDFNVHFHNPDNNTHKLLNLFRSFGFSPLVNAPTRKSSCLDNIFINFSEDTCKTNIFDPMLSDHSAIKLSINRSKPPKLLKRINYRPIHDSCLFELNNLLRGVDWGFIDNPSLDVDTKFELFVSNISYALDVACPIKSKVINHTNKTKINWFTNELRQMRDLLYFLHDVHRTHPSNDLKSLIANKKRIYRSELNKARKTANDNFISTNNNSPKAMWNLINKNKSVSPQSEMVSAEDFNNYFATTPHNLIGTLPPAQNSCDIYLDNSVVRNLDGEFDFSQVSFINILDIINNLKKISSKDPYDMNIRILNSIKYIILVPLTKLINLCIQNNVFPKTLKLSKVVPIHKNGSIDEPANHRPIVIIPVFAKILEIVLKLQITFYFENFNLFNNCQFGFRAKKSTTLAINSLVDLINKGFEDSEFLHAQFLDLSKAFDCVSHNILINKLTFYKFSINSRSLLNSYLEDRSQYVQYQNAKSNIIDTNIGVPQGSVLGPLLFLIYINDLPNCTSVPHFTLFADDTTLTYKNYDINRLLSNVNDNEPAINDWFLSNQLVLNTKKTQSMTFSLRHHTVDIDSPDSAKFLGVYLDHKLSWEKHTIHVCKKMSSNIFLLRSLASIVSHPTLLTAYHGLIHSAFSYAILVWGHSAHTKNIFSMQRKAIRVIAGLGYRDDCKHVFKELSILTLPSTYILHCLLYIKENQDTYTRRDLIHNHATRNNKKLNHNFLRLTKTRNGTNYYAIKFFNVLPDNIQKLEYKRFKTVIKKYLLDNAFYDINEYLSSDLTCITM